MKNILILLLILVPLISTAQEKGRKSSKEKTEVQKEPRKIIMQLTSADTTVHKMLMKQLNNILTVAPDTKIEVVCHGPGLNLLVTEKSIVNEKLSEMKAKGVDFVACKYSMSERKVEATQLNPNARIVEAGIIEIVDRQNEGWAYIKAG